MNTFFSSLPYSNSNAAISAVRIITGGLVTYHGLEVFDQDIIDKYLSWDVIKNLPAPEALVYTGKIMELFAGLGLLLGLFTRAAALSLTIVMLFICFKIGSGKFYYDDQHPFLFALMGLLFFFTGPGKWSLDKVLFDKK